MPFDVAKAIEALGKATEKGFSFAEEVKGRQSETEVIKFAKQKMKAIDAAEQLIILMYPNFTPIDENEEKKFKKLLKIFLENN
jgi:hypothetical protein